MFRKPFTVKNNANVRSSDRRKILSRLQSEEQNSINSLLKMQVSVLRVVNFQGISVNVYLFDKEPFLFEIDHDSTIFPTVYMLWKFPRLFPTIFIGEQVMSFLENGADLMLPGVILWEEIPFPSFKKGAAVSIATISNGRICGPLAVGRALLSSDSILASGMKGRGVEILHLFKDQLWESGSQIQPPLYSLDEFTLKIPVSDENIDVPPAEPQAIDEEPTGFEMVDLIESCQETVESLEPENLIKNELDAQHMEELLTQTFFSALKYKVLDDNHFPYDTGNFYANFILKSLPPNEKIDLKKTRFKKFNNFIREINEDKNGWVVKISSKKGIDLIQEVNWEHPLVKNAEPFDFNESEGSRRNASSHIRVAECYSITEAALNVLRASGGTYRKGDIIQPNDLRDALLAYAKKMNLERDGKVELDDTLQTAVKHFLPVVIPINDLVQRISNLMTKTFMITTIDGKKIIRRMQVPQITFQVEKRAGNKVVTLVNNLSVFGIDPKNMASQVQSGAATGATIVQSAPNCEGPQLLINGNHVNFVGTVLLDDYGLNKKYIKGLELGVKQKKGKK
uniref:SUI1 domain-containing protein n=2 Tax=Acrobeloides nanus TaxID=290746 RepID=A0A914DS19_9BILA